VADTIFLVLMIVIFCVPISVFAWFEYGTALLKVIAMVTFMITGLCLVLGAGPNGQVKDGSTWHDGLAFRNGFQGFGSCVLLAVVAIGGGS
jgi:yeast amino acid transporter